MPGTSKNPRRLYTATVRRSASEVQSGGHQSYSVIIDPTEETGDPSNNYATTVTGYLFPICAIDAYGIATFVAGAWVQVGSTGSGETFLTPYDVPNTAATFEAGNGVLARFDLSVRNQTFRLQADTTVNGYELGFSIWNTGNTLTVECNPSSAGQAFIAPGGATSMTFTVLGTFIRFQYYDAANVWIPTASYIPS